MAEPILALCADLVLVGRGEFLLWSGVALIGVGAALIVFILLGGMRTGREPPDGALPDGSILFDDMFGLMRRRREARSLEAALQETDAQRAAREAACARELRELEHCHAVLAERIKQDDEHAWVWRTRDKVAVLSAGYLRNRLPAGLVESQPPLSDADKQALLTEHPLLQEDRQWIPESATSEYQDEVSRRLREYFATIVSRRDEEG